MRLFLLKKMSLDGVSIICCLDIFNLFFEDFWLYILFVETSMQLKSGDNNVYFVSFDRMPRI